MEGNGVGFEDEVEFAVGDVRTGPVGQVVPFPDGEIVVHQCDGVDGGGADHPPRDHSLLGERYSRAHFPAVQGHIENDALATGGVRGQVAHRVEQRIPGERLGAQGAEAARLRQATGFGRGVARLAQMVVAGGGKAHLVTVVQVHSSEPLEGAVLGHDLDQGLQQRVVQPVVAGLVGVGYHHHVFGIVVATQALVEQRQGAELLGPGCGDVHRESGTARCGARPESSAPSIRSRGRQ